MTEKDFTDNRILIDFWSRALDITEEDRKNSSDIGADGWKDMAPSEKLYRAAESFGSCRKVLDYGCGNGWAGIIAAKNGCMDVTSVDVAPGAVSSAAFFSSLFGTGDSVITDLVEPDWIGTLPPCIYDGFICSNVLDVVPPETAEYIIREAARIVSPDAKVIIGLNFCMTAEAAAKRGIELEDGNRLYVDGVLRMVSRTDEEWEEIFSPYFTVEKLEHFAWPGEQTETRRLFYLRKKLPPVRRLEDSEIPEALDLAWNVFSEYESPVYSAEGTEEFRKRINDREYLSGVEYYGTHDCGRLIGILGIRPDTMHISFFFVDGAYHRRGIGTRLFRYLEGLYPGSRITLNSSPYGIPFYKALGFEPSGEEKNVNGIRFTPMTYEAGKDPDVMVRRVRKGDEEALARVQTESWRSAFGSILDSATLERCTDLTKSENMFRSLLDENRGNGYILEIKGKPHCISYWDAARDPGMDGYAELISIHSLPDNRRRGYGRMMMDKVLGDIRKAGYPGVVLWVFTENRGARAFYEAAGFHATETVKHALGTEEMLYAKDF